MKKFFLLGATLLTLAACQKEAMTTVRIVETPKDKVETEEAIRFGTNIVSAVKTKAAGAIEEWTGDQDLYVFGLYQKSNTFDFTVADDILIDNVKATSPIAAAGQASPIVVLNSKGGEGQEEPFYYKGNYVHKFFSYYVDDAADPADVNYGKDSISLACTFNGTQDIMLAKADPETDIESALSQLDPESDEYKEINTNLKPHPEYLYSAYSARRGVHPVLKYEHQLARFVFKIKVMNKQEARKVNIESISLSSCSTGMLNIATNDESKRGIVEANDTIDFYLHELNEGSLSPIAVANLGERLDAAGSTDSTFVIGNGIMVTPLDVHDLYIKFKQDDAVYTDPENLTEHYVIKPSMVKNAAGEAVTSFQKGKQYTITICIWGLSEIQILAELSKWEDGGNIEIGSEDFWTSNL